MSDRSELAILGGEPSRTKAFLVEPMTGAEEEALVLEAMREKSFSRYIGMMVDDGVLKLKSSEAHALSDYWHVLGGRQVRAFAAEFAAKFGVDYAVPVSSATAGLSAALAAAGVGPGDEVIVPAISFSATAMSVLMFNSVPVFADVDPQTFCITADAIEAAITPHTRAILVVHLAGNMADMDAIMAIAKRRNLVVIEDACQAIGTEWRGRKAGSIGHAGVFSFQQSKNMMTGEGGMVITNDAGIARRARLIANHGELQFDDKSLDEDMHNVVGLNFRLPELCAAVGRAQLAKLDTTNAWRTRNHEFLQAELANLPGLHLPKLSPDYQQAIRIVPHFTVALYNEQEMGVPRAHFVAALRAEGIPVGTGYVRTLYENPTFLRKIAYGKSGCPWTCGHYKGNVTYERGQCPVAEKLLREQFLWFYHIAYSCTQDDMRDIAVAVRKVVSNRHQLASNADALQSKLGGHSAGRIGLDPRQVKGGANAKT